MGRHVLDLGLSSEGGECSPIPDPEVAGTGLISRVVLDLPSSSSLLLNSSTNILCMASVSKQTRTINHTIIKILLNNYLRMMKASRHHNTRIDTIIDNTEAARRPATVTMATRSTLSCSKRAN